MEYGIIMMGCGRGIPEGKKRGSPEKKIPAQAVSEKKIRAS